MLPIVSDTNANTSLDGAVVSHALPKKNMFLRDAISATENACSTCCVSINVCDYTYAEPIVEGCWWVSLTCDPNRTLFVYS